jgi:hypothetical protein
METNILFIAWLTLMNEVNQCASDVCYEANVCASDVIYQ